jgi:hypothetical protein
MNQTDLFVAPQKPLEYEVHYRPPDYPERLFPSRCKHEGPMAMLAELHLVPAKGGGRQIEIDHSVCFGCGLPQVSTYGGNALVDLTMILATQGAKHWKFAQRANFIRGKWARIATYLFDENGWNGRHERIAKIIDPRLTMKLFIEGEGEVRMGRIKFDQEYLRPLEEEEAA